ncbi:LAFE_0G06084g1_1 [Lachancea fermentati]|uniref:LAFE_0G06084g1_1 n=1 Tax=Lachancea fermentati TaxID=4955 RepID=A0A1G4MHM8_LACFM|nr:LAFE_0G06084g1_1 [Lachancea fermentati]
MKAWEKQVHGAIILLVFLIFQLAGRYLKQHEGDLDSNGLLPRRVPRVQRYHNSDASLCAPFLDKINEYWITKGEPQIRNYEDIRLTSRGRVGQYGVVMSNGVGDNTVDDFEIEVTFKIYNDRSKPKNTQQLIGDGMAIVISPEKDFMSHNMLSSYARKQYEHNSGGILGNDRTMMGFPKNLPGLAIVVDTYRNSKKTKLQPPFLSLMLNIDPEQHHYSPETDGEESTGYSLKPLTKLKKSLVTGAVTKLRIIYLESIGFLKIDMDYSSNGNWIEIYQKDSGLFLPKNMKTGQRFIGVGASTGELTETVEIKRVDTYEFHWEGHDEDNYDYVEEMKFFLAHEYGEYVNLGHDDFANWKMARAEGLEFDSLASQQDQKSGYFFFLFKWCIILFSIYMLSVYVRVSLRRLKMVKQKHKHGLLG